MDEEVAQEFRMRGLCPAGNALSRQHRPAETKREVAPVLPAKQGRPCRVVYGLEPPEAATAAYLRSQGCDVFSVEGRAELAGLVRDRQPQLVVLNTSVAGPPVLELIQELRVVVRNARVILTVQFASVALVVEAMRRGAADVLLKPVMAERLLASACPNVCLRWAERPQLPTLDRLQWDYIHMMVGYCQGNVSEAARKLGIYRQSLQRMLRRHPPRR